MDRATLRNHLRSRRQSLSKAQQTLAAHCLASVVCSLNLFHKSKHIAIYLATDGEVNTEHIIKTIWDQEKLCYLPVLDPNDYHTMHFQLYHKDTILITNQLGITEPYLKKNRIAAKNLDLVMMPLTCFDERGNRLGMGGGFYDRTFAFVKHDKNPILIGLAHECQKVDNIPVAGWDVPMMGVATDKTFHHVDNLVIDMK